MLKLMSEEKRPVLKLDLQLADWERRNGPTRRVLMTRNEFMSEIGKTVQRKIVIEKLLAARNGLTNRQRRALDKERRSLIQWQKSEPLNAILHNPSWWSEREKRIADVRAGGPRTRAQEKKLRWLMRKHPSWVSEAELRVIRERDEKVTC